MTALPAARASRRTRRGMGFLLYASARADDVDPAIKDPTGIVVLLPTPRNSDGPRVGAPDGRLASTETSWRRQCRCRTGHPSANGRATKPQEDRFGRIEPAASSSGAAQ